MTFQQPIAGPLPSAQLIGELRFAEQFLIWSYRFWAEHRNLPRVLWPDLRTGFGLIGAEDALLPFVDAMSLIAAAHLRPLHIHCVTCRQLGTDEMRLNAVVFSFQSHEFDIGARLLADFLPPAAVRQAGDQFCLVAAALADAGVRLPPRLLHLPAPAPLPAVPSAARAVLH